MLAVRLRMIDDVFDLSGAARRPSGSRGDGESWRR